MAESMNIAVNVAAAESPFSNRLVDWHNLITANMINKILEESQWNTQYISRDSAYFKKINKKLWRGPGKVLGQDKQ